MNSSRADGPEGSGWGLEELQLLGALGFGPDSVLMSEPKLFVDTAFLAALQRELMGELGGEEADRTLFHIGLIHGLRDASRIGDAQPGWDGVLDTIEAPPLAMRFGGRSKQTPGSFELAGSWPDHFEAEARLSKLGASEHPACLLSAGYTSGWLSGTLDRDVVAIEVSCVAAGDECCTFVAKEEASCADTIHGARRLPIAAVRAVVGIAPEAPAPEPTPAMALMDALPAQLDPEDPAVHIWGPVMVMPFTGPDAALQIVEMLGSDDSARTVRVVVMDLCGTLLDDSFGAAALENVVEVILSWGAEVILTGIAPLSEEVVAELQASLLLSRKDLPEAIAYAFQIADAQRHLL
jgi:predicted hydrocarbon binding protein